MARNTENPGAEKPEKPNSKKYREYLTDNSEGEINYRIESDGEELDNEEEPKWQRTLKIENSEEGKVVDRQSLKYASEDYDSEKEHAVRRKKEQESARHRREALAKGMSVTLFDQEEAPDEDEEYWDDEEERHEEEKKAAQKRQQNLAQGNSVTISGDDEEEYSSF